MSNKIRFAIDVCKIGNSRSTCAHKERMEFYYYKDRSINKKVIYQCGTVGNCDQKRQAIMTIEEEETYES